jgi:FkbM family methyltransferase
MLEPLFSAADLERSGLTHTRPFLELAASPVGLIDVGARWGISEVFSPAASFLDVLAFEPDPEEAERLKTSAKEGGPWAGIAVEPFALADSAKKVTLHLLARANNSSIYPVRQEMYDRYKLKGFELVKTIELDALSLDQAVFAPGYQDRRFGEILKIDAQGAELEILRGAERVLSERTQCLVCEAAFFTPYDGACLFSDVERFLRDRGLRFYGFLDFQHRSTKRLDKRVHRARERMMQADAVFFRDPLDNSDTAKNISGRQISVLLVASTLFGYFDFSAELAALPRWNSADRVAIGQSIAKLAEVPTERAAEPIEALRKVNSSDSKASLVAVGRWVDRLRDFQTYHDVTAD